MLQRTRQLLEMIRFSHTVFALPFALLAGVMAWTAPLPGGGQLLFRWQHLAGILVCMVGARSAAMAFNRLADRRIDGQNPRTRGRHLPAGLLSVGSAVAFTCVAALLFLAGTLLFLPNRLPLLLALPVLAFLLGYSFAKRFTSLAHFWLGAALMLAPVAAWIALRGETLLVEPLDAVPAVLLGLAVLFWVAGFDIIYACQDAEFDAGARLRSVPVTLGVRGALRLAAACHLGMLLILCLLPLSSFLGGPSLPLGWIYGCGLAAVAGLLVYEHALVRPDDLTRVNVAFFHVNTVVSVGLFLIVSLDMLL
ncbi:MAG: UbiA family prenyltransferase [Pirellulaceae bacterium]|nr:UbiA family prenyltransferase [Pirellulaceae bacterium]